MNQPSYISHPNLAPQPPARAKKSRKPWLAYGLTALVAFGIGLAAGSAPESTAQSSGSTETVTVPAPAETVTEAGAAQTVTETVTAEAPAPAETTAAGPATTIPGDGTFQVGVDVQPGTYVSAVSDSGNCYWARLSGQDSLDSIIDNNNSSGQSLVTIKATDKFFESSGCNTWQKR